MQAAEDADQCTEVFTCPFCGCEFVHFYLVWTDLPEDKDRNEIDIIIRGQCEDGHEFNMSFNQHKGYTFVTADKLATCV